MQISEADSCVIFRIRQFPLYNKTAPPPALADHFTPDVFAKSQTYGRDKAKFSFVSTIYKQLIDTVQLGSGLYYPWAWSASASILQLAGYGPEYQVSLFVPKDPVWRLTYPRRSRNL